MGFIDSCLRSKAVGHGGRPRCPRRWIVPPAWRMAPRRQARTIYSGGTRRRPPRTPRHSAYRRGSGTWAAPNGHCRCPAAFVVASHAKEAWTEHRRTAKPRPSPRRTRLDGGVDVLAKAQRRRRLSQNGQGEIARRGHRARG